MKLSRKESVRRRHQRVRRKINGTAERPRFQIIDDVAQHTLAAASTQEATLRGELESTATQEASAAVGKLVAQRALDKGIEQVVFDRGGNLYHGRVKALAEAARSAGLNF